MTRFAPFVSSRPRALTALAVGALATAAWLGSPAAVSAAQPAIAAPEATVYYSFRDLASEQSTRALYERIVSAARTVCPGSYSPDLGEFAGSRECQRKAVSRAIHEIGSARLAAVYSRKTARHG